MPLCLYCDAEVPAGALYCQACGQSGPSAAEEIVMFECLWCTDPPIRIFPGQTHCPECGRELAEFWQQQKEAPTAAESSSASVLNLLVVPSSMAQPPPPAAETPLVPEPAPPTPEVLEPPPLILPPTVMPPPMAPDEVCNLQPNQPGICCPSCQKINEAGTQFCIDCGTNLAPRRPAGHPNVPGAKFCARCGKKIGATIAAAPAASPSELLPADVALGGPVWGTAGKPAALTTRFPTFFLVVLNASGNERLRFKIKEGDNLIGARSVADNIDPAVDLSTAEVPGHKVISRRHASLRLRDGMLSLCDLGSTNGTSVGGKQLKANDFAPIDENSEIVFANIHCRIRT